MASSMGTVEVITTGLTKRELYAAFAMQGIMSNSRDDAWCIPPDKVATISVQHADALIAVLSKEPMP